MNAVEPIRDPEAIEAIERFLKDWNIRNYVLFCFGIYAPVRISDILPLKVKDVRDKQTLNLVEKKTRKQQRIAINTTLRDILDKYTDDMMDYEYLFASRQKNKNGYYGPISRQQAYNIMKDIAKKFSLENIGCHSTRKTFGYHYYQQTGDIVTLQKIFNHSDISITMRYIGLTQDMKNNAIKNFSYKTKR